MVEQNLKTGGFDFEWVYAEDMIDKKKIKGLRKWNILSPWKEHPITKEKFWVNMIVANHASYFHAHPNFPQLAGTKFGEGGEQYRAGFIEHKIIQEHKGNLSMIG